MAKGILKKNNLDFPRLIEVPEASKNSDRISWKEMAYFIVGRPINKVSSTNR